MTKGYVCPNEAQSAQTEPAWAVRPAIHAFMTQPNRLSSGRNLGVIRGLLIKTLNTVYTPAKLAFDASPTDQNFVVLQRAENQLNELSGFIDIIRDWSGWAGSLQ